MIKANIYQIKTHFSEYIAKLEQGESIMICKRNVPIAEIRPLRQQTAHARPLGLAKGLFEIPDSFFEDLPEDITKSFYHEDKA